MTNLVAELRTWVPSNSQPVGLLLLRAADEIERLQNIFEAIRTGAIKPEETRGAAMEALRNFSHEPRAKPQFIGFVRCTFDSSEPMCAHEGYVGVSKDCPEHSSPLGAGADRG